MRIAAKLALVASLFVGASSGASAAVMSWTFAGTIASSYDHTGSVFGQAGSNKLVGSTLTLTFLFDLAKLPNDLCLANYDSCWQGSSTSLVNGYGYPGGSWISTQATVSNGVTGFAVQQRSRGMYANRDQALRRTSSDNRLVISDRDEDVFQLFPRGGITTPNADVYLRADRHFVNAKSMTGLFGNNVSPSLTDPLNPAGTLAACSSCMVVSRFTGDVAHNAYFGDLSFGNWARYIEQYGFAVASITSVQGQLIPLPGTLVLLGLGLFCAAAASRRRER